MLKHLFKARKLASIDLQYPCTALHLGATRNSATIGIQNATENGWIFTPDVTRKRCQG